MGFIQDLYTSGLERSSRENGKENGNHNSGSRGVIWLAFHFRVISSVFLSPLTLTPKPFPLLFEGMSGPVRQRTCGICEEMAAYCRGQQKKPRILEVQPS